LHKSALKKFPKRRVTVTGIDKIWAADLVDMQAFSKDNDGVRYLLTVIDVFSKYGWMIPLKTKTGAEVANALKEISKERKADLLWTDKGLEFFDRHVKSLTYHNGITTVPCPSYSLLLIQISLRRCRHFQPLLDFGLVSPGWLFCLSALVSGSILV